MVSPASHQPADVFDLAIIGGGIVGLATALALTRRMPGAKAVILEKEDAPAKHQTGHNSGVIHSGIYYKPGSLKAALCREGAEATKRYCESARIPFETCGKLLVATTEAELERMEALIARARDNEVECLPLSKEELRRIEPEVSGLGALLVPSTGIVDYAAVCNAMASELRLRGVSIRFGAQVTGIAEDGPHVRLSLGSDIIRSGKLVVCAGLQSDRLARLAGLKIEHRIVPFRGEYYTLPSVRAGLVRHLIYPIPNPDLPFLGIHLTRTIDGGLTVGPNAVLGFAREGYPKGSVDWRDVGDMASFPGFWRVLGRHWRSGMAEFASAVSRRRYLAECRKYCPGLVLGDLQGAGAGIRAQAVRSDGTLVDDFLFLETDRMLHVCNAPSPAATSALPIGERIAARLLGQPIIDLATSNPHKLEM